MDENEGVGGAVAWCGWCSGGAVAVAVWVVLWYVEAVALCVVLWCVEAVALWCVGRRNLFSAVAVGGGLEMEEAATTVVVVRE